MLYYYSSSYDHIVEASMGEVIVYLKSGNPRKFKNVKDSDLGGIELQYETDGVKILIFNHADGFKAVIKKSEIHYIETRRDR